MHFHNPLMLKNGLGTGELIISIFQNFQISLKELHDCIRTLTPSVGISKNYVSSSITPFIAYTLIFHFKALKSLKNMRVHVLHVKALLTKWPTAQLPFVEKEEEL